jgi:hypothetical protein
MYSMFSTAYYRLILLLTFESADRVAKVKREIGSETTVKLRSGCYAQSFAGYRLPVQ